MTRRRMTPDAERLMHGSCRHVTPEGHLVVVDTNGIVTVPRPADRFERASLTLFGKLCLAVRAAS